MRRTDTNSFWGNVRVGQPNRCWDWLGARNSNRTGSKDSYGILKWAGKRAMAHQVAWELANGPLPEYRGVTQVCFNKLCCNPAHLELCWKSGAPVEQRFWSYVDRCGEEECWEWQGGCFDSGAHSHAPRGCFWYNGKTIPAYRMAWILTNGPIDDSKIFVCHNCPTGDNSLCCNPKHLFLGDSDANNKDAAKKGLTSSGDDHYYRIHPEEVRRGEQNHLSKLTEQQVIHIRELYATDRYTTYELAEQFNTIHSNISYITKGKTWAHLPNPAKEIAKLRATPHLPRDIHYKLKVAYREEGATLASVAELYGVSQTTVYRAVEDEIKPHSYKGENNNSAKLTEEDVKLLKEIVRKGVTQSQVAKMFKISQPTVSAIMVGRLWKHVD